jgi:hypothetical protein
MSLPMTPRSAFHSGPCSAIEHCSWLSLSRSSQPAPLDHADPRLMRRLLSPFFPRGLLAPYPGHQIRLIGAPPCLPYALVRPSSVPDHAPHRGKAVNTLRPRLWSIPRYHEAKNFSYPDQIWNFFSPEDNCRMWQAIF